jgi:hypothetical protein
VVDDVPLIVHMLQQTLGIPVYHAAINELFTPVGDENGLLIVVQRGRLWFPESKVTATVAPLTAIISDIAPTRYRIDSPPFRLTPV